MPVNMPVNKPCKSSQSTIKKIYTRKCPNKPAKYYDLSHIMVSENDGKQYIVIQYTLKNGNELKKWIKV